RSIARSVESPWWRRRWRASTDSAPLVESDCSVPSGHSTRCVKRRSKSSRRWRGYRVTSRRGSTIIYKRRRRHGPRRVESMSEVLLVTGMSGAGRSTVSAALEDLGWFVIDNLPLELVVRVGELASAGAHDYAGVSFIFGRSGGVVPDDVLAVKNELLTRHDKAKILFLDAPDDVL